MRAKVAWYRTAPVGELPSRLAFVLLYYRWKSKFGGMEVSEAKRLRQLEEENGQLKHIVAEQAVDIRALKAVVATKW
jgi:hypothetical protein